ncbi:MAG: extensin family protein [Pseudomonadota bacterium]
MAICAGIWAGSASANAPEQSLRPEARPGTQGAVPTAPAVQIATRLAPATSLRPTMRPTIAIPDGPAGAPEPLVLMNSGDGVLVSLRPQARPARVARQAAALAQQRARGQVCGDPAIQGRAISAIPGRISGCGITNPVRVTSVAGLRLTTPATIDCRTAQALRTWVDRGVKPAVGSQGGGAVNLRVVASYACRTRNNQPGAKISEHGRGRAIDIAGIGLRDGSEMTLLTDWNSGAEGRALKQMWRAACGPFGTVLGPDSNRFHRDHFHFDTARYRSGSYCR